MYMDPYIVALHLNQKCLYYFPFSRIYNQHRTKVLCWHSFRFCEHAKRTYIHIGRQRKREKKKYGTFHIARLYAVFTENYN